MLTSKSLKTIITWQIALLIIFCGGCKAGREFSFVAMGDSRGLDHGVNTSVLGQLSKNCINNNGRLKFVVFGGDMIMGPMNANESLSQLTYWKNYIDPIFARPIYPVPGNHEIRSAQHQENYKKVFAMLPDNGPEDEKNLTYYFDHGKSRFIMIDTDYFGDQHRIRHPDWLEKVLADAREKKFDHIFVVGHDPAFPTSWHLGDSLPNVGKASAAANKEYLPQRDRFWDLLKKYKVAAYICGHEHLYSRQNVEGVWQIINGGAGANPDRGAGISEEDLKIYYERLGYSYRGNKPACAGSDYLKLSVFHFIVFDVSRDKIVVRTYGAAPAGDKSTFAEDLRLVDQFEIIEKY